MTRVLHICDFAAPYPGAFIRQLLMLEDEVSARGGRPSAFAFPERASGAYWIGELRAAGHEVVLLPEPRTWGERATLHAIHQLIERVQPDIVHTHFGSYDIDTGRAIRRIARVRRPRLIWHYRTALESTIHERSILRRFKDWIKYARAGRDVDLCVTVTRALAREVADRGMDVDRVLPVVAGCDTMHFTPPTSSEERRELRSVLGVDDDDVLVMHLGWHWHRKGGDLLAQAARLLEARGISNVRFISVGASADEVEDPIRRIRATPDVVDIYRAADIFVSASRSEGFGNGLVEAMSCERVAVAALASGQREVFARVPGVMPVAVGSAEAIADGIQQLIARRADWKQMGQRNRRHIEDHHSMRRWAHDMSGVYASLTDGLAEMGERTGVAPDAGGRHASRLSRFKVLMMVDCLLSGGAERVAVELAAGLDQSRFDPHVLVTRSGGPLEQVLIDAGVGYTILGRTRRCDLAAWRRAKRLAQGADIIHAHKLGSNVWAAALARWCQVPLVAHDHNFSAGIGIMRRLLDGWWVSSAASRVVCVADTVADAQHALGVDPQKIVVVPNGVRTTDPWPRSAARDELGLRHDAFVVGMVARLRPEKDHAAAIAAMARVCQRNRNVQLCIVGDGPERARIEQLTAQLSLPAGTVVMAGEHDHAARLASACDVALIPSRWEGMPLAALESMAAGVPVIASRVGSLPELIGDDCGWLVDAGDVAGIADAIIVASGNDEALRAASKAARRKVAEHYTFRRMLQRVEGLYVASIAEHHRGVLPSGHAGPAQHLVWEQESPGADTASEVA